MADRNTPSIKDLFPEGGRILLTGGGKEFVERIGVDAIRHSILSVMMGENIRTQTEPLSRRKIAIVSGAIISFFLRGHLEIENFTDQLSSMAVEQLKARRGSERSILWISQWLIGLTQKQFQNVLRSDSEAIARYLNDFEAAINEAVDTFIIVDRLPRTGKTQRAAEQIGRKAIPHTSPRFSHRCICGRACTRRTAGI